MTYPVALPHVTAVNGSTAVQHRMFEYAAANPAGQAMSTALDLAQVGIMLLNQGRFDGEHVLRPESVVEILRPQISLRDVEGSGYGLGFWTLKYKSLDWVTHGGFLTPYLCEFSIFPQAGIGVMFACNATTDFNPIRSDPRLSISCSICPRIGWHRNLRQPPRMKVSSLAMRAPMSVSPLVSPPLL
jgi:CubicO group peptidase (beta-lactamase class C family)